MKLIMHTILFWVDGFLLPVRINFDRGRIVARIDDPTGAVFESRAGTFATAARNCCNQAAEHYGPLRFPKWLELMHSYTVNEYKVEDCRESDRSTRRSI